MIRIFSKYKVLAAYEGMFLLYHKGKLYTKDILKSNKVRFFLKLPIPLKKAGLIRFRLTERLFRLEPRLAIAIDRNNFLISCIGKVYLVNLKEKKIIEELKMRPHMNNPLMFAKDENGNILFGEYFSNNEHEEVCIYERDNGLWNKVYSFPAGMVYHIHSIVVDGKKIYILTGDDDKESAIWYTDNHFETVEKLVGGMQKYRACIAYPFDDGLLYATDTPIEQNYLYLIKKENNQWKSKVICKMPGPCIYGTARKDGYYFATSVEPDATLSNMRYRFSYKLGVGVKDRYTHIIHYSMSGTINEVVKLKKDVWPMLLFQFGNCTFPYTDLDAKLLVCPISLKKYDGKTIEI